MPDEPQNAVAFTALLTLLEITRSVWPLTVRSGADPRSFATWTRQERQLVAALHHVGISNEEISGLVSRTPEAIVRQLERMDKRETGEPAILRSLPHSSLPITSEDIRLLGSWPESVVRDPFGYRFGAALPEAFTAPSPSPELRVIMTRPNPGLGVPALVDWESSVQAVTMDLAGTLLQRGTAGVLHHSPDPHHARHLALRDTIGRVTGSPPRRGGVVEWNQLSKTRAWDTVLIAEPERWRATDISGLVYYPTVILVQPDLSHAQRELHDAQDQTSLKSLITQQEALLQQWGRGRKVTTREWVGWPNSHGSLARIDWPALAALPPHGELLCARPDLLIRASVWIALTQRVRTQWPVGLRESYANALAGITKYKVPIDRAVAQLWKTQTNTSMSDTERVMLRVMLDAFYPTGAAYSDSVRPATSDLRLTVGREGRLTYIGR